MLHKNILFLLLSICTVCIISCEPKEEPVVEVSEKWEIAGSFKEGLSHAKEINGALFASSRSGVYADAKTQGSTSDFNDLSLFIQGEIPYRLPLSDKLMVAINTAEVSILPAGSTRQDDALVLNMREIDPEFTGFHFLHYYLCEQISINANGNILVPYRSAKDGIQKNTPDFLLLKTLVNDGKVTILEQKLIKEEHFLGIATIRIMKNFPDFTRVTIDGKTFDIDSEGNLELRFEKFSKSVQVGNEIITFAQLGPLDSNDFEVYKSDLSGENNELIGSYGSVEISTLDKFLLTQMADDIYSVDGVIILRHLDRIYRVTMNSQKIALIELENEGMGNGYITSVLQLDDETVFATTLCDRGEIISCGGFTKSLENFFKPKAIKPI